MLAGSKQKRLVWHTNHIRQQGHSVKNSHIEENRNIVCQTSRFLFGSQKASANIKTRVRPANDRLISSEHVAVDQVSTAATEMGAAVHEVARNVQNAADAARQAEVQSR